MSRGNINVHFDHPLRLAAVASDALHYSTGGPCFRGHLAERYAKSGRCVRCVAEDRKKWESVQPAEYFRRRANTPGTKRKQKRRYDKMVALYDMLVANGLPVNPERTLSQRRQDAWRAFRELTSDDPIYTPPWQPSPNSLTERCRAAGLLAVDVTGVRRFINKGRTFDKAVEAYLASKVRLARAKQQRKQRKIDWQNKQSAQQQRDEKLREIARTTGAKLHSLRKMMYDGASFEKVKASVERMQLARQRREIAEANGVSRNTLRARVYTYGWDWQRAITEKPSATLPQPNSISGRARANGVSAAAAHARIASGWSVDDAVSRPMKPNGKGIAERARANGIPESAVYNRIGRGWTIDDAVTKPLKVASVVNHGLTQRAKDAGMSPKLVLGRVNDGWSIEEALTIPPGTRRAKNKKEAAPRVVKLKAKKETRQPTRAEIERAERRELRQIGQARHEAARLAGRIYYERMAPCKCGGRTNYVSSKTCAACVTARASARYECLRVA